MKVAITRGISSRFADCELTHLEREAIDLARAQAEHAAYVRALRELDVQVMELAAVDEHPDCAFVEDASVVFPECAVITRPGAPSRRGETADVEAALASYRRRLRIEPPGTLDGGDVLVVGRQVYVGATARSNAAGIEQLAALLAPFGYTVRSIAVSGCLHLKSAVTQVAPDTLLINPAWVDRAHFPHMRFIEVDPHEPAAANALQIDGSVIYAAHQPRTQARLEASGIRLRVVEASEVAKAEGAVTCCSLVFDPHQSPRQRERVS